MILLQQISTINTEQRISEKKEDMHICSSLKTNSSSQFIAENASRHYIFIYNRKNDSVLPFFKNRNRTSRLYVSLLCDLRVYGPRTTHIIVYVIKKTPRCN